MSGQQGDVLLQQTNDDGEITVVNGVTEMTGSFETAAYLSLFGGNEDDDGREGNPKTWWGNRGETDPARRMVSETQYLTKSIPATSANLRKIEDAAKRDLAWFVDTGIANTLEVVASIPALNWASIVVTIEALGEETEFTFTENWKAGVN